MELLSRDKGIAPVSPSIPPGKTNKVLYKFYLTLRTPPGIRKGWFPLGWNQRERQAWQVTHRRCLIREVEDGVVPACLVLESRETERRRINTDWKLETLGSKHPPHYKYVSEIIENL